MNRLAAETSPYLRQHADNPVDWFPWGEEAFARARAEDKPLFLSVGYSACHWCHVMAHESFEDESVAAALNEAFVAVKVDREERPDVDAVYMEAVHAMTGQGGWPMSVFLTPDGRPFLGGTYFPPVDRHGLPGFGRLLGAVADTWTTRREEVEQQADALAAAIAERITLPAGPMAAAGALDAPRLLGAAIAELRDRFDPHWGGFGPAPKFPQPGTVELCLRHHRLTGDPSSLAMAETTLRAMAAGGMYDHLGGGFCRYSTDTTWTVPHFEKMLYDQAGLVRAYLHAWQQTGDPQWLAVVEETVDYVLRDLRADDGGLYSAEDADSEGEEGRFYLWTRAQIEDALGPDEAALVASWYGVDGEPNFEGRFILRRPLQGTLLVPPEIAEARRRLFEARAGRVRPGLDDKVLTEWNAMFLSVLAEAAAATANARWESAALSLAQFLLANLREERGRWLRSWQGGRARHLAYAADYAWLVDGFTRLAELTGQVSWSAEAATVARDLLALFGSEAGPLFTTGSDAESLVVRPAEVLDGATPSATAVAGTALVRLGALRADEALGDAGAALLESLAPLAGRHPLAAAWTVAGAELLDGGLTEVVVAGDRPDLLGALRARYEPTAVVAWGERTGGPLWEGRRDGEAYVCRRYACATPATTAAELVERLDAQRAAESVRYEKVPA
ncbi:MAG: thioredoxin domain-containing protein [Acidimicrobiales bacterium]